MDEMPEVDPDQYARQQSLDAAIWFYENAPDAPAIRTPDDVIAIAVQFEHYLTDGGTVAFDCADRSRKFVRGQ